MFRMISMNDSIFQGPIEQLREYNRTRSRMSTVAH